eukprot:2697757-Rhodomonas_salina.1
MKGEPKSTSQARSTGPVSVSPPRHYHYPRVLPIVSHPVQARLLVPRHSEAPHHSFPIKWKPSQALL